MKTAAIRCLRRKLAADQPTYGLWIGLDAPAVTEIAVGLGLGVAVAVALEYFDTTVRTPDDVERYLGLPVIGIVPRFETRR